MVSVCSSGVFVHIDSCWLRKNGKKVLIADAPLLIELMLATHYV